MVNKAKELLSSAVSDGYYSECEGVGVIRSGRLSAEPLISHGFTTRKGGISSPPFDTLDLGTSRDEPLENILGNYRILSRACGLEYEKIALVRHEHGDKILRIDSSHAGRGLDKEPLDFSDGLVTDDPGVILATCHADCCGFFLFDKKNLAIGLAHAGWKGMYKRIGQKLALRMHDEFGSEPSGLIAAIAPCICEKCFEVDMELAESFAAEFRCPDIFTVDENTKKGKAYVSLHAAALIQLLDAGLTLGNVSLMRFCTFERKDLFYSYRRDGRQTGSMAAYLKLNI